MKIAMPVNNKSTKDNMCNSFGRAPYFLVYDLESEKSVYIDNTAANSQGGAGIKAAQIIVDNNVNILITPRCGENAADVINSANIKIYKSIAGSADDNIKAFKEDQLSTLEDIHSGFHNHGGR